MGWMAWDLMRGVDLLLATPGVDPGRIILLGAVAGGGDPAAVAAALDPRIAAAVPFNFGGPQPETAYPLPEDAETAFDYAGGGGWESTRNLRLSAADGFLPWVIVGGIAPRRLVYGHEFRWDQPRDPVWKRLQTIYGFYDVPDRLSFAHGRGELRGQPPEATHCTHIGPAHREQIHKAFARWFDIKVTAKDEYSQPLPREALACFTPDAAQELRPRFLRQLATDLAEQRLEAARRRRTATAELASVGPRLAEELRPLLGTIDPLGPPKVVSRTAETTASGFRVQRIQLEVEPEIVVPLLVITPQRPAKSVVVAVVQTGKEGFLAHRADELAKLLASRVAIVLPDLRGTGETRAGDGRSRTSADTDLSATELMLGSTLLGARLRDLRSVLRFVRAEPPPPMFDNTPVALWGDSFAPVNAPESVRVVPHDIDQRPHPPEPLGTLLVLLAALYEPDITAIYAAGGLTSMASILSSPQVLVPHDAAVPGMLTVADVADLAAALAPRRLCIERFVDAQNVLLSNADASAKLRIAVEAYERAGAANALKLAGQRSPAQWLLEGRSP